MQQRIAGSITNTASLMFNAEAKDQALSRLKAEVNTYDEEARHAKTEALVLFELRQQTRAIVLGCESYLSELANAPRELVTSVGKLRTEYDTFQQTVTDLEMHAHNAAVASGGGAAAGVATGVGVAALAPTAAMAIATTFGTASTGTAISALAGAAATNAALAWLGGGAVIAGGGGMVAGNALLALAGPVGWAIGGASLIGAGGYAWHRNTQIAEEANQKAAGIHKHVLTLQHGRAEMNDVRSLTVSNGEGVREQLQHLQDRAPQDYLAFTTEHKQHLGALINNVNALAELLNRTIAL